MFQEVNMYKNNARSKRVERHFGELRYEIEKEHTGWLARPFAKSEKNQKGSGKEIIVPYEKLVAQCMNDLITWNNMPKKGTQTSRWDYYVANQNPNLKKTNFKAFVKDLGRYTPTSCKAGIIKLQSAEWLLGDNGEIATGEKLISIMKQVEGKDIDIYWLSDSNGNVMKAMIYDNQDGRYICEAISKPKSARASIEATPEHIEAREILQRYIQTVDSYMRNQKNAIEAVTVIDHRKKTVNNNFTIGNFNGFEPRTTPVEELEENEEETLYTPREYDRDADVMRDHFLK